MPCVAAAAPRRFSITDLGAVKMTKKSGKKSVIRSKPVKELIEAAGDLNAGEDLVASKAMIEVLERHVSRLQEKLKRVCEEENITLTEAREALKALSDCFYRMASGISYFLDDY